MFRKITFTLVGVSLLGSIAGAQTNDSLELRKITNNILLHSKCYSWLNYLCTRIGGRLTGSPQAAAAVEYTRQLMDSIGADSVYLQPCMVPRWRRGEKETAKILTNYAGEFPVHICALGGSVATPPGGVTAQVIEVHNFSDLERLGVDSIRGKIVFYNRPFDETDLNTFDAYGNAVDQRWNGPSEAAKYGAVATIVRSMTNYIDEYPHTGSMAYNDSVPRRPPCCAIATADADELSKMLKIDPKLRFHFEMSCYTMPDVKSYNVIAELKGTEYPDQIIVIGGHLDSWDLAQGANDDGSGIVQSLEVLRTFRSLGIRPKRTIRIVMFMNEENGSRGSRKYAEEARRKNEHHIAAIESDAGSFSPRGFGLDGTPAQKADVLKWKNLLLPYGLYDFLTTDGGEDISRLKPQGALLLGLEPDSQCYFKYHHTAIDLIQYVNKRQLELGAASMAMMAYLLQEYGVQ